MTYIYIYVHLRICRTANVKDIDKTEIKQMVTPSFKYSLKRLLLYYFKISLMNKQIIFHV